MVKRKNWLFRCIQRWITIPLIEGHWGIHTPLGKAVSITWRLLSHNKYTEAGQGRQTPQGPLAKCPPDSWMGRGGRDLTCPIPHGRSWSFSPDTMDLQDQHRSWRSIGSIGSSSWRHSPIVGLPRWQEKYEFLDIWGTLLLWWQMYKNLDKKFSSTFRGKEPVH